jgi:hypothetical protein
MHTLSMHIALAASLCASLSVRAAQDAKPAPEANTKEAKTKHVDFPHPLITEILYSVPGGRLGDANKDGTRSATGDEFVELVNPHDKPIELEGYRLSDGAPVGAGGPSKDKAQSDKAQSENEKTDKKNTDKPAEGAEPRNPGSDEDNRVEFVFPKLTLQPGEVVVVFNGFESSIPGSVGDSTKAGEKNDTFHNAYVFTMKCASSYAAFSNQNDMVLLTSPKGEAIECARWDFRDQQSSRNRTRARDGAKDADKPQRPRDKAAEAPAKLVEELPNARNSVQRTSLTGDFTDHLDLNGTAFSPGTFETASSKAQPEKKPAGK